MAASLLSLLAREEMSPRLIYTLSNLVTEVPQRHWLKNKEIKHSVFEKVIPWWKRFERGYSQRVGSRMSILSDLPFLALSTPQKEKPHTPSPRKHRRKDHDPARVHSDSHTLPFITIKSELWAGLCKDGVLEKVPPRTSKKEVKCSKKNHYWIQKIVPFKFKNCDLSLRVSSGLFK